MAKPQNTHNLTELYVKQFGSDPALVRVESLGVFLLGESEEKPVYYRVEKGTAFVPVQGVVSDRASLWYRTASAERLVPVFHELALRPDVKKVVLEIDSPGGSVVALGQIVDALKILKASKPVSSYVIGLCCSAALYLASLTDDIAASSMAMIGSLGVVTMYHDTSKLYNDVGIKAVPITTGEMKVMGVGGVPITESQINTVREKMQRILTDFKAVVQAGRKMSADRVDLIASKGDYWEAAEALRLGLIDKITPHEVYRKENTMSTDTNTTPEPAKTQQTASAPLQSQVPSLSFNETRNIITAR